MLTVDELATIPLFSTLAQKELEYLVGAVEDIHLIPGEYVRDEQRHRQRPPTRCRLWPSNGLDAAVISRAALHW